MLPFAALGLAVGGAIYLGRKHVAHRVIGHAIRVPRVSDSLNLDGELVEPSWHSTPVVHLLKSDGSEGRPYADVRFLWNDQYLFVGLYASDHDIVSAGVGADGPVWLGDSFHVVFSKDGIERSIDVGITASGGIVTDGKRSGAGAWDYRWQSGARVATDTDGTVDHPGDNDEEWVVEMQIPLSSLDLSPEVSQHAAVRIRRCDVAVRGMVKNAPCSETEALELVFAEAQ